MPRMSTRLGPFRHPAYSVYWAGGFVSNLGTWLQAVAGSIFVYQLTQSSFAVGVYNFAGFIPILLFSVWGGQISDRFDRRGVVVVTHVISIVAAGVLAILTIGGVTTELQLIVTSFVVNTMWALGKPSYVSLVPNIVPREDLQDAVGLNSLQFIGGQIAGPLIAAAVMAASGAGLAFTINALTYLGPIVAMLYLYRVGLAGLGTAAARKERAAAAAVSGATFVRTHLWVPTLLVAIVASAAAMEIQRTLAPALVVEVLGEPESAAGIIVAAQSFGSALALFLFVAIRRRGWSRTAALVAFGFQALGVVTAALAPTLLVACLGVGLIGFGFSLCFPVLTATLQEETPDGLRGRIMSYHQMAHLGNRPFTALFVGSVAAALGTQVGVLSGVLLAPIGFVALRTGWQALAREQGRPEATIPLEAASD
jgi:MFS family permease